MDSQKEVEKTATGEEQKEEQAKKPYPIEVEYCPRSSGFLSLHCVKSNF